MSETKIGTVNHYFSELQVTAVDEYTREYDSV